MAFCDIDKHGRGDKFVFLVLRPMYKSCHIFWELSNGPAWCYSKGYENKRQMGMIIRQKV